MLKIRQNAKVDVNRAKEIEEQTRHDVVAFTRQVSETLGRKKMGALWTHFN